MKRPRSSPRTWRLLKESGSQVANGGWRSRPPAWGSLRKQLSRESRSPAPPLTPPDMRVRIRRFGERQGTKRALALEPLLAVRAGNDSALWQDPSGFTAFAPPAVSPSGESGLLCSFHELSTPGTFTVRPFPVDPCDLTGTMASADPCHLNPPSQSGLPNNTAWWQVSPDKSANCPRTPARFTALPLDGMDFVISCSLVQAHGLLSGSCSSGRGFASGFLQTPPRGDALALGYGWCHQPPGRTFTFLVSAHAGRTTANRGPLSLGCVVEYPVRIARFRAKSQWI